MNALPAIDPTTEVNSAIEKINANYGDPDAILNITESASNLLDLIENDSLKRSLRGGVINAYIDHGLLVENIAFCQQQLKTMSEHADSLGRALIIRDIGTTYHYKVQLDSALKYYNRSLGVFERINNLREIAGTQNNLALLYHDLGNYDLELKLLLEVYAIEDSLKNYAGLVRTELNLSQWHYDKKNYRRSLNFLMKSLKHVEYVKDSIYYPYIFNNLANAYAQLPRIDSAHYYYKKGLETSKSPELRAQSYAGLASVFQDQKRYDINRIQ